MIGGTYTGNRQAGRRPQRDRMQHRSGTKIHYVGQQYYRNLPQNFLYTHTLPINWNRRN